MQNEFTENVGSILNFKNKILLWKETFKCICKLSNVFTCRAIRQHLSRRRLVYMTEGDSDEFWLSALIPVPT